MNRPKLWENCAFLQNFHTRKSGKITEFYTVQYDFGFLQRQILHTFAVARPKPISPVFPVVFAFAQTGCKTAIAIANVEFASFWVVIWKKRKRTERMVYKSMLKAIKKMSVDFWKIHRIPWDGKHLRCSLFQSSCECFSFSLDFCKHPKNQKKNNCNRAPFF